MVDYSARYGLSEGISRTFDGKHPCSMCETITQSRKDEAAAKSPTSVPPNKITYLVTIVIAVPQQEASSSPQIYFASTPYFAEHYVQPVLRPPRTLAA